MCMHFHMYYNNVVLCYHMAIYKHIHGDILIAFVMSKHILIQNDKSTHISLMSMYFHMHNDNTIHMFH